MNFRKTNVDNALMLKKSNADEASTLRTKWQPRSDEAYNAHEKLKR